VQVAAAAAVSAAAEKAAAAIFATAPTANPTTAPLLPAKFNGVFNGVRVVSHPAQISWKHGPSSPDASTLDDLEALGVLPGTMRRKPRKTEPVKPCDAGRYTVKYQNAQYCMSCNTASTSPECHPKPASLQCVAGHYLVQYSNKNFCISCPPGKYSAVAVATQSSCPACPTGRYQPAPHQTSCLACLATGC
jgi:hypothetical protein